MYVRRLYLGLLIAVLALSDPLAVNACPACIGPVVTSSVRIAGIMLFFSYLIVPALVGLIWELWGARARTRWAIGWCLVTAVSFVGMLSLAILDLPTGATVVGVFGLAALMLWTINVLRKSRDSGEGHATSHQQSGPPGSAQGDYVHPSEGLTW